MYRESYTTARGILGFLIVMGWVSVGVGAILTLLGFAFAADSRLNVSAAAALFALTPGIVLVVGGLTQVALAHVGYAVLDQADISRATLGIMQMIAARAGVEVEDTGAAHKGDVAVAEGSTGGPGVRDVGEAVNVSRVGGRDIYVFEDGTAQLQSLGGGWKQFGSLEEAKQYIS